MPEALLLAKSLTRLDSSLLVPDSSSLGASAPLRATVTLGLSLLVMGSNCSGPVFSLSVIDAAHFGPVLLPHSFA